MQLWAKRIFAKDCMLLSRKDILNATITLFGNMYICQQCKSEFTQPCVTWDVVHVPFASDLIDTLTICNGWHVQQNHSNNWLWPFPFFFFMCIFHCLECLSSWNVIHYECCLTRLGTCKLPKENCWYMYQATSFSIVMETDFTARFLSKKLRFGSVAFFNARWIEGLCWYSSCPWWGQRESPARCGLLIQPLQKLIRDRVV